MYGEIMRHPLADKVELKMQLQRGRAFMLKILYNRSP
jgi:hypothetical protein